MPVGLLRRNSDYLFAVEEHGLYDTAIAASLGRALDMSEQREVWPERKSYKKTLRHLQVQLVKLQRHLIKNDLKTSVNPKAHSTQSV